MLNKFAQNDIDSIIFKSFWKNFKKLSKLVVLFIYLFLKTLSYFLSSNWLIEASEERASEVLKIPPTHDLPACYSTSPRLFQSWSHLTRISSDKYSILFWQPKEFSTLFISYLTTPIQLCATAGFELSVSQSRNVVYFSVIAMPKKSHFTIFAIQNFVKNTNVFVIVCNLFSIMFVR